MIRPARLSAWIVVLGLCLSAGIANAQARLSPLLPLSQMRPGPLVIIPSITVGEEYNDNVFLESNKRSDFVTTFTPGIAVIVEQPTYRLTGQYTFTSELYNRFTSLDDAVARMGLALEGSYRFSPSVSVGLAEAYARDRQTNIVSPEGFSSGLVRSWSNTVSPNVTWQVNPLTTVRFLGSYAIQRYDSATASGSDVYRVEGNVERALTPRLSGTFGYQFAIIDVQGEPTSYTHTPRLGGVYRITETLTVIANAGPTFIIDGGTRVTPAATVTLRQLLWFGSVEGFYDRAVGTGGPFGGTTDNQSFGAAVRVTSLLKGLTISAGPGYTTSKSSDNTVDVQAVHVGIQAQYQFLPWLAGVASYTFFDQHNSAATVNRDLDQNRVFLGLQFGYPIRFD